jgi:hypothetical protein
MSFKYHLRRCWSTTSKSRFAAIRSAPALTCAGVVQFTVTGVSRVGPPRRASGGLTPPKRMAGASPGSTGETGSKGTRIVSGTVGAAWRLIDDERPDTAVADDRNGCGGHRAPRPDRPASSAACPRWPAHRAHAVGESRRLCTVHGRLRTAIEASNARPSHHHSFGRRPWHPAAVGPLPFPCSIVRHKSTPWAALQPNKPYRGVTEVASSHIRHSCGPATAMEHPATVTRYILIRNDPRPGSRHPPKTSSLLVIALRQPRRPDNDQYRA